MSLSRRFLKKEITAKIRELSLEDFLRYIERYPEQPLIHSIMACFCSTDQKVKWHAITAFGEVMKRLADQDMEKARVVMRRCMWMLNDESGGIGWGIPEAFAEALYQHADLAAEYTHVLVSFMREDGFYLELEFMQQGLIWGIGRLAERRAALLQSKNAVYYLMPYLNSNDSTVKALAGRAAGLLGVTAATEKLQDMLTDKSPVQLYSHGILASLQVGELSAEAISSITTDL